MFEKVVIGFIALLILIVIVVVSFGAGTSSNEPIGPPDSELDA